ncbi:MAG: DivIVA domain-containing protein [Actinomycetota bacterium]|nr:MAG: cell division initiation [Actinomycetota bacterium]MDO8949635.1 DivIVA domain-containing protein [Actinomycetota bacterium]MDP3630842.1 DivIVA domain-containing protein [Actinomycetota bacterium]
MKLTPLDIHHKEFGRSLRGYNEAEVDAFLDQVADELERLFKENIDLSERNEAGEEKVKGYQDMERTLHNTMVSAQKSAEDIIAKARQDADLTLRDAEVKAKEIIHNALQQKQKTQSDLMRIKAAEEDFRGRFKALLEGHMRTLSEIPLPEDVRVLTGETDSGMVGDVEVASAPVSAPPTYAAAVESKLSSTKEPESVEESASEPDLLKEDTQPIEPPASGFVQGLQLGETVSPELPVETEFLDVPEFKMDFGSVGEREDDIDIEEID